jgi:hypothetical protein
MSKRLTFVCIILLVLGMIVDANAASTLKMTCNGNLTNNREDGVTLGNCDLNFIKVKEMTEIENVCGIPELSILPLKINVEYERLSHPIQALPQITGSYTRFLRCGR